MPRQYRLTRADFQYTRGFRRVNSTFFMLSYGTIPGRVARGGACVISKKVAGTAVARNRVKRQARIGLVPFLERAGAPLVVVLIARKGAAEASAAELRADVASLMAKVA